MEPISMIDDEGITHVLHIDCETLEPLGFQFNARVRTSKGTGSVIGVQGEDLYVLLDVNCAHETVTGFPLADIAGDPAMVRLIDECAPAATRGVEHRVKQVVFSCQCMSVVMQGRNGPCPVLALANALLLGGKLKLKQTHANYISAAELQNALADYLWTAPELPRFLPLDSSDATESPRDSTLPTIASVVHDAARLSERRDFLLGTSPAGDRAQHVLARMYEGLDVDPVFASEESFVGDNAVLLFALAGVRLLHGWVIPAESPYAPLRELSFNQLVDLVASAASPVGGPSDGLPATSSADMAQQQLAASFYDLTSAHQMTEAGLRALEAAVGEREVVVLFRRNHFFTLTKLNGRLLALCSDENFADKSTFVFSRLDSISEDGNFTDGEGIDTDPLLSYIQACTGSEFSEECIQLCRSKLQAKAVAQDLPIDSVTHQEVLLQLQHEKEATRCTALPNTGVECIPAPEPEVDDRAALEEKVKEFCDVFPYVGEDTAMELLLACEGNLQRAVQLQLEQ
ncbi:hypothetical protein STCU_00032 [Strigomonas culicis]|uniref:MINDY deubiquitinase domain-containing protein n=1 Tax=Strigomonas culicis TaxID=28005 RepID=S9UP90_9TRYP|nr:hypothetical protein STCU_06047 [Strigomonas culicis]EPY30738.1 hypothetical protein STCU_03917 [Strigomonas culicis]EPY37265.1 hypothetical protein STCU_00032 [Strigomonas culicis]|eukprot:EPY26850.1 hypothetical protein STCU_06047 [Strigomonas culicis]